MALRACIIEGKGDCNPSKLSEYQHIMRSLWDEISDIADLDKVNLSFCQHLKMKIKLFSLKFIQLFNA